MLRYRVLHLSSLTDKELAVFIAGYAAGVGYAMTAIHFLDKKRVRTFRRTEFFNKRLLEEAWVYLPPEVKDKINNEVKFYNIAGKEDI